MSIFYPTGPVGILHLLYNKGMIGADTWWPFGGPPTALRGFQMAINDCNYVCTADPEIQSPIVWFRAVKLLRLTDMGM